MRQQSRRNTHAAKPSKESPASALRTPMPEPDVLTEDAPSERPHDGEHISDTCMATKRRNASGPADRSADGEARRDRLPPGLFLAMQPIMSMTAPTESLNFEVLLRVRSPDGSVQAAGKAIASAEKSGTIAAIDKWVITTVLEWVRKHRAALANTRFICVNLSGSSINDEQFLEDILALFARFQDIVPYLCLEITESAALDNLENTQRFISHIHGMGGKIALDDFGSGYNSFKYLRNLSADALKIDGEFIRTMCAHPTDIAIVAAIVTLARSLGMRSIAEWVENIHTLRVLKDVGVDYVQGFLVARPQDAMAILGATSAASFVEDPAAAQFIRDMGNAGIGSVPACPPVDKSKLH